MRGTVTDTHINSDRTWSPHPDRLLSSQDAVTWTTCSWCRPSVGRVSQPPGSRPVAVLWDTRGSSVSAVRWGSDAPHLQTAPSAPANPVPAGGAAAIPSRETVTLPTRPAESRAAPMASTATPGSLVPAPNVPAQTVSPARWSPAQQTPAVTCVPPEPQVSARTSSLKSVIDVLLLDN